MRVADLCPPGEVRVVGRPESTPAVPRDAGVRLPAAATPDVYNHPTTVRGLS